MSRKEELTQEAAAWRECAEWCSTRIARRSYLCDRFHPEGWVRQCIKYDRIPTHWPRATMAARLGGHYRNRANTEYASILKADVDGEQWYEGPGYSDGNHPRVMFCLLMALECEAEAKEVTRRTH